MGYFLPQLLVLTLDVMVTLSLWVNYRNSRMTYLAIACGAGVLEIGRQIVDNTLMLDPGLLPQPFLLLATSTLQFFSSFVLLYALLRSTTEGFKFRYVMLGLLLLYFL